MKQENPPVAPAATSRDQGIPRVSQKGGERRPSFDGLLVASLLTIPHRFTPVTNGMSRDQSVPTIRFSSARKAGSMSGRAKAKATLAARKPTFEPVS